MTARWFFGMKGFRKFSCNWNSPRANLLVVVFLSAISGVDSAQEKKSCVAGVYHTVGDFADDRLSHKINTAEKGDKFEFLFPADLRLTIRIIKPDTTLDFKPGS